MRKEANRHGAIAMRALFFACLAAIVIATGGAILLNAMQKDVDVAFSTSGVRI
jgi:hypothetical protein